MMTILNSQQNILSPILPLQIKVSKILSSMFTSFTAPLGTERNCALSC